MPKPLIVDQPYPSLEGLTTDIRSGNIISFAYATQHGELTAILQYIYQTFFMSSYNEEYATTLEQIAIAEMKHLDILGEAMLKLGVDPIFRQRPTPPNVYYQTGFVSQSKTPQRMLMDDIEGEMIAIADYNKMLFLLQNDQVSKIIQRIILDEQLHLETFKKMLENVNQQLN